MTYFGPFLLSIVILIECGCVSANGHSSFEERLHFALETISRMVQENATIANMWQDHLKLFQTRQKRTTQFNFQCNVSETVRPLPSSVHDLRPEDIRVVGAMGDSLTAGNGALAHTILGVLIQDRGRSWSIGGDHSLDQGVLTLPNILRKYTSSLIGFSVGSVLTLAGAGGRNSSHSRLNVAEALETSNEMPMQARMLVDRIRNDTSINMTNDWKLVTMFIGANDLCKVCSSENNHNPAAYVRFIREALDILHAELPRTFVNLVQILDITPISQLQDNIICDLFTRVVCECGRRSSDYPLLRNTTQEYHSGLQHLIATRRYDTRDDFTVVLQPFFSDAQPPRDSSGQVDMSYFAPDCFHFSEKSHQAAATALWNNMLQPVSQKDTTWNVTREISCPEHYGKQTFATHLN